jgi:HAD superfamily hydrolase (TIGR01509 family)
VPVVIRGHRIGAAIFDTDGVVTDTASVHFGAWKDVFDEALHAWAPDGRPAPFTRREYLAHVDGVPRYDGVERWLGSRDIELPHGSPADPPGLGTVCALGNAKNERFLERLRRDGVPPYESTVAFVTWLRDAGVPLAVISASRNAAEVLAAAGVDGLFLTRVDGEEAARLDLAGKPEPDVFLEAARRLGVPAGDSMVVEDALLGVEAARRGGFGLVVGVDRAGQRRGLLDQGADLVVDDLAELLPT